MKRIPYYQLLIFIIAFSTAVYSETSDKLAIEKVTNDSSILSIEQNTVLNFMEQNKQYTIRICFHENAASESLPEIFYLNKKLIGTGIDKCYSFAKEGQKELFQTKTEWKKFFLSNRIQFIENFPDTEQKYYLIKKSENDIPFIFMEPFDQIPDGSVHLLEQYFQKEKILYIFGQKLKEKDMIEMHHFLMENFYWIVLFEVFLALLLGLIAFFIYNGRHNKNRNTPAEWEKYSYTLKEKEKLKIKENDSKLTEKLAGFNGMTLNWKKDKLKIKIKKSENKEIDLQTFTEKVQFNISNKTILELEPFIINDEKSNKKKLAKIIINLYSKDAG